MRDLCSDDAVRRDAAVARLTVIGPRAVERLVALVGSDAAAGARVAALRALEAIEDTRGLHAALGVLDDLEPAVSLAAVSAARPFLRGPQGPAAIGRLIPLALDSSRAIELRTAAIGALTLLGRSALKPLRAAIETDPDPAIRSALDADGTRHADMATTDPIVSITTAADGALPDDPGELHRALTIAGADAPLPLLARLVEQVRNRAATAPDAARAEWTRVRGAAHVALARRGSRLALYDLREALEAATTPLPVEFLTALSLSGDGSCLEPIAAAYARSADGWWKTHLADAFHAIVKRERLTKRHAVMKKIERKWGQMLARTP